LTQSQNADDAPWWESELPLISKKLGAYVRSRLPAWREDHDDLVSDTLLALMREIRNHPSAFPGSWFQPGPPANEAERSHLHKFAMVVLKRRIADLFRKRAPLSNVLVAGDQYRDLADPDAPSPERKVLLARMLQVTLSVLSGMPPADRDLIAFIAGETGLRKTLDARERQRLHRLRMKLRDEIMRRLGTGAADLLRDSG
jgi:DNA-directed RNA polymerase specialized sigma24 family protein